MRQLVLIAQPVALGHHAMINPLALRAAIERDVTGHAYKRVEIDVAILARGVDVEFELFRKALEGRHLDQA